MFISVANCNLFRIISINLAFLPFLPFRPWEKLGKKRGFIVQVRNLLPSLYCLQFVTTSKHYPPFCYQSKLINDSVILIAITNYVKEALWFALLMCLAKRLPYKHQHSLVQTYLFSCWAPTMYTRKLCLLRNLFSKASKSQPILKLYQL